MKLTFSTDIDKVQFLKGRLAFSACSAVTMAGLMPVTGLKSNSTYYIDEHGYTYLKRSENGTVRYMYCRTVGCPAHGRDDMGVFSLDEKLQGLVANGAITSDVERATRRRCYDFVVKLLRRSLSVALSLSLSLTSRRQDGDRARG